MAPRQSLQEPLRALLLPHYEEYQRSDEPEEVLSQTVGAIKREIDQFALSVGVQGIVLDDSTATSHKNSTAFEYDLAASLIFFLDCAFVTESSVGSIDAIENVLELTAAVTASFSIEVADFVLARATEFTTVLLERIRSMGCKFLGALTKCFMDNSTRNNDLLDKASQALLPRFTDKSQTVRQAAIEASSSFFAKDVTDPDILQALVYSVQHDPSVASRVAALQSLPINLETVDVVLSRVRDIKMKVRVTALKVLEEKNVFPILEAEHCAALVETGMTDRCAATKAATISMIRLGWMKAVGYDPIKLLVKMKVMEYDSQCELLLKSIIGATKQDLASLSAPEIEAYCDGIKESLVPVQNVDQDISIESLFFTRVVCSQLQSTTSISGNALSIAAANIFPDVSVCCDMLESNIACLMQAIQAGDEEKEESLTAMCQQLLSLTAVTEFDEGSRRHLIIVMKRMLSSVVTPDDLVEDSLKVLQALASVDDSYGDHVAEIVEEIERLSDVVGQELQDNHLLRTLGILTIILEKSSSEMREHMQTAELSTHILPALSHESELVREAAVNCLGRLGFATDWETLTEKYEPLLLEIATNDVETVIIRAQALLALSDWCMLSKNASRSLLGNDHSHSLYEVLSSWFNLDEPFCVCVATEIASKLLFNGVVDDRTWLAQLVMVFFDPSIAKEPEEDSEDNVDQIGSPLRLQQLLSVFFPAFCLISDGARDNFLQSVDPLLDLIHQKHTKKKKNCRGSKSFPIQKMVSFICDSVRHGDDIAEGMDAEANEPSLAQVDEHVDDCPPQASIELTVAIQLARFLESKHSEIGITFMRTVFKILNGFDLSHGIQEEPRADVATLKILVDSLGMAVDDARCTRGLEAMGKVLADVGIQSDCEGESADGSEDEEHALDGELADSLHGLGLDESKDTHTGKENIDEHQPLAKNTDDGSDDLVPRSGLSVLE